jgi:hypothetical protein
MVNKMIFHENELDDNLKENLARLAPTADRNPEKAAQGRAAFLNKAKLLRARNAHLLGTAKPKQGFLQALFGKRLSYAPLALALVITFALVFGGGWGTVYAAQGSLPNDFLYPVKLASENFRLNHTSDPVDRVNLLIAYTGRRIDEATSLNAIGEPIPEKLPIMIEEQLDEIFTLAASMDLEDMEAALTGVQRHLRPRDQIQGMTNAMNGQPEDIDPQLARLLAMLQERQELAKTGLESPNQFQQQLRYQQGKPTLPITPTITSTITSTVTVTPEITITITITPGHYGPGPCEVPGVCTPPAEDHGPFEYKGTPPGPDDHEGYGPGSDQGQGPQYPTSTPLPDDAAQPTATPKPSSDNKSKDKSNFGNKENQ